MTRLATSVSSCLREKGSNGWQRSSASMEEAYQSWQKMLDAGAWIVYPSHGKSFPATLLRENIGKIKSKI